MGCGCVAGLVSEGVVKRSTACQASLSHLPEDEPPKEDVAYKLRAPQRRQQALRRERERHKIQQRARHEEERANVPDRRLLGGGLGGGVGY